MTGSVFETVNDDATWAYVLFLVVVAWGWLRTSVHRSLPADGDAELARELDGLRSRRTRHVAAALVDLDADPTARFAFIGASTEREFEIGSVTKGLTGMLVADAVERGELTLDTTVSTVLRGQEGTTWGSVTVRELCTHTSGLPRLPRTARLWCRGALLELVGLDPYRRSRRERVLAEAARQPLHGRGRYRYSNLGGAVLGHLVAAAAGTDYASLLEQRIFRPLGMDASAVSRRGRTAPAGRSAGGRRRQPWVMDGYAPAGGVLTTVGDLALLTAALLDGTAPGSASVRPLSGVGTAAPNRASGMFWVVESETPGTSRTMVWHNGQTGGYSAYLVLYPQRRQAVVVLADTARAEEQRRIAFGLTSRLRAAAHGPAHEAAGSDGPA